MFEVTSQVLYLHRLPKSFHPLPVSLHIVSAHHNWLESSMNTQASKSDPSEFSETTKRASEVIAILTLGSQGWASQATEKEMSDLQRDLADPNVKEYIKSRASDWYEYWVSLYGTANTPSEALENLKRGRGPHLTEMARSRLSGAWQSLCKFGSDISSGTANELEEAANSEAPLRAARDLEEGNASRSDN
ncbi:uncharacterized protein L199_007585 [Kwoniella botswanensis]|uniref:uncharacterized protein n=1 Tax=Kwoniella botswanensis TaxID=1268659 RepID=UPI00315CBB41